MNNYQTDSFESRKSIRLLTFLMLLFCLSFFTLQAQNTLSIQSKNEPVEAIFKRISQTTKYKFFYDESVVKDVPSISLKLSNVELPDVLEEIAKHANLSFDISDLTVTVSKTGKTVSASPQQTSGMIKGKVTDKNNEPIVGASVIQKGTTNGVSTDVNGEFNIRMPKSAILQVTYIGYITQEIIIENQTSLTITLEEDTKLLDEVVVIAFGTMKKEAFTGSAGVLNTDNIIKSQQDNAAQILAGRVSGVQINNASGQFGESPQIIIRGVGSISSDIAPLIVVDGMPFDGDLATINPADIESMTVLKDAASNALYGARGANGVIMVTTKKGKMSGANITLDAKWGVNQSALKTYDYIKDPKQYYEVYYKALYNKNISDGLSPTEAHKQATYDVSSQTSGKGPGYMVYTVPEGQDFIGADGRVNPAATLGNKYSYNGQDYWLQPDDWEKEALRNGFRQEYLATIAGANEMINYYSSLGYLQNEGITNGSKMERITGRLKADYQAKKWLKVGANVGYTKYDYDKVSEGVIGSTGNLWSFIHGIGPIYPLYLRDGNKNIMIDNWGQQMYDFGTGHGVTRPSYAGSNPAFFNKYNVSNTDGNSLTASLFTDVRLSEKFKLTVNASILNDEYRGTSVSSPYAETYSTSQNNGSVGKSHSRRQTYNTQQLLNYTETFANRHNLNVLLGHEYYNYQFKYLYAFKTNMAFEDNHELNGALNNSTSESSYVSKYNNEGYFSRAMYDYDGRYHFSGSFRRDASSRFSNDKRWGNFWSFGGAWIINKEEWYNIGWMNEFKFKASIGSQGNDNIGDYLYSDQYNITNSGGKPAFTFKQKGQKDITWETNTNINTGVEFALFDNRISGSVDYFYRKTSDMLFSVTTPPSIGYTSYYMNVGDMRNSGLEFEFNTVIFRNKNFYWDFNFNISHVKNKVLTLPEDKKTVLIDGRGGYTYDDNSFVSKYKFFIGEGLPLYTWYIPQYAGVNEEGLSTWYKNVKDESGKITGRETTTTYSQADSYLCGTALPDFFGGFGTTLTFKGFDLSLNLNYQIGGRAYDRQYASSMAAPQSEFGGNFHKDVLNAWTPENKGSNIPRFQFGDTYQTSRSDRFLESASFLNLQNLNFGYTFSKQLLNQFDIDGLRLYISCENVAYISARRGFDPRQSIMGYSVAESYTPIRTISFGLNIRF